MSALPLTRPLIPSEYELMLEERIKELEGRLEDVQGLIKNANAVVVKDMNRDTIAIARDVGERLAIQAKLKSDYCKGGFVCATDEEIQNFINDHEHIAAALEK